MATILVRAELTEAEYLALRKLALDRNKSVAAAVADALRATYNLNGAPTK